MVRFGLQPSVLLSVFAAVVSVVLAAYVWRRRSTPGSAAFVGLMLAVAAWAAVDTVNLLVVHPPSYRVRSAARWLSSALVPVAWLSFALSYTGRDDLVSRGTVLAMVAVPATSAAVILAGDPLGVWLGTCTESLTAVPGTVGVGDACQRGPLYHAHLTYDYTLLGLGFLVLLKMFADSDALFSTRTATLVAGGTLPAATNVLWRVGLIPAEAADPTPAALTVMGLIWGYAAFLSDEGVLDVVPGTTRIGQRTAIEDFRDGVAILDGEHRVLSVNDAGCELLGVTPEGVAGRPVGELLGEGLAVEPGQTVTEVETDDGRRMFEVTVSELTDSQDRPIGHTLVFREVTERRQRKQQLEALNRVLRHNLRNDLNVVQGYADTLAERTSDPEADMAEFIAEQSAELVEVGSKVRDMERIMERRRSEYQQFDLGGLLREVTDGVRREFPESRVVLKLPQDLWLRSDDLIVETIVQNLVRNAVEHNDADTPEVEVTGIAGREEGGWVEIVVEDNGPGIPEQERAALREGRETDLQHGSGLGLWVVNWGVTTLGGDLRIEDADGEDGGSVVRVRLPGHTAPPEGETDPAGSRSGAEAD